MRRCDVHAELVLLGVSSEVHALVDDLDLDIGPAPLWLVQLHRHLFDDIKPQPYIPIRVTREWDLLKEICRRNCSHVYKSNPNYTKDVGRLFED